MMSEQYARTLKPLSLSIERLGPIKDSGLELGDITLLLGRPNTGKSYVLRAIYSSLAPLDPYFLGYIKKFLVNVLTERLVKTKEMHQLAGCVKEAARENRRRPCSVSLKLKLGFSRLVNEGLYTYGRLVAGKYSVNRPSLGEIIEKILEGGLEGKDTAEIHFFLSKEPVAIIHVSYRLVRDTLELNVEAIPPDIEVFGEEYDDLALIISLDSRSYSWKIASIVVDRLMEKVPGIARGYYMYTIVSFLSYGRGLLSRLLERPLRLGRVEGSLARALGVEVASMVHRIKEGYEVWLDILEGRGEEWSIRLVKALEPLLEGRLLADARKKPWYVDWSGAETPLTLSSALVGEYAALLYAALASRDGLLLIEEPESQLHPSAQVAMAVFLAALPSLCGCHVVASTHSDLLALTLSYIAHYHPSPGSISQLLQSMMPHASRYEEGLEILSKAAASSAERNLRIYYFERDGGFTGIRKVEPSEVMSGVPGIKETLGALASWVGRLEWSED